MEQSHERRSWEEMIGTGRSLEQYLRLLDLSREDIRNKRILDAGAGAANFARDIQAEQLDTNVVSLEPRFALPEDKRSWSIAIGGLRSYDEPPEGVVAGVIEDMPFADETFDMVLATSSLPLYYLQKILMNIATVSTRY